MPMSVYIRSFALMDLSLFFAALAAMTQPGGAAGSFDLDDSDPLTDLLFRSSKGVSLPPPNSPKFAQPRPAVNHHSSLEEPADPIYDLVHLTSDEGSFVEAGRYKQPCPAAAHLSWLTQPAADDSRSEWLIGCTFCATYLLVAVFLLRTLAQHSEKHLVNIRSPMILKVSILTGFVALSTAWFGPYLTSGTNVTWLSHFTWVMTVSIPSVILPHLMRGLRLRSLFQQQSVIISSSYHCEATLPKDFRAKLFDFEEKVHQLDSSCSEIHRMGWLLFLLTAVIGNGIVLEMFQSPCQLMQLGGICGLAIPCIILAVAAIALSFGIAGTAELHCIKCEVMVLVGSYLVLIKALLAGWAPWYRLLMSVWIVASIATPLSCMLCNIFKEQLLDWLSPHCSEICDFATFFQSPLHRSYFDEYLATTFHPELPQCWRDLEEYRRQFEAELGSPKSRAASSSGARSTSRLDHAGRMRVTARNIFNKYIREDALMHVPLCDNVTQEICYRLHSNNITAYSFVAAQEEVFSMMAHQYAEFLCHPLSSACFSRSPKKILSPI